MLHRIPVSVIPIYKKNIVAGDNLRASLISWKEHFGIPVPQRNRSGDQDQVEPRSFSEI
jgi:hypothetical protein